MESESKNSTPEAVTLLAERCLTHVQNRLGMTLDYQVETLGVVDSFIDHIAREEGGGRLPAPGDDRRAHLVHLLGPTIGAYFGEVMCRTFPCRWRLKTDDPADWFLEFDLVPLRFNPVGAAVEALASEPLAYWNGAIATEPGEMEPLFERLAVAPPVLEEQFFALTTRLEVLQIAQEWLQARQIAAADTEGEGPRIHYYSSDYYDGVFGS
jgi:hypothetical protein